MRIVIRGRENFWAGCMFAALGVAAILISRGFGSSGADEMGPAYFPTILGALLAGLGALLVVRSLALGDAPVAPVQLKAVLPVLAGVLLFATLLRGAGLFPVVVGLVVLGGMASARFKPVPYLLLGLVLATFSSLLFVKGLGLPMPVFGTWFGI